MDGAYLLLDIRSGHLRRRRLMMVIRVTMVRMVGQVVMGMGRMVEVERRRSMREANTANRG